MMRLGRLARGLRRADARLRRELTVLRTVVGQDRSIVERKKQELAAEFDRKTQAEGLCSTRYLTIMEHRDRIAVLERVLRWLRWLFQAL